MRSFVCLAAMLGLFSFLIVHYSFWPAVGIMYLGGMLLVAVIALAGRNKQAGAQNYVTVESMNCQVNFEEQTGSEELKAA